MPALGVWVGFRLFAARDLRKRHPPALFGESSIVSVMQQSAHALLFRNFNGQPPQYRKLTDSAMLRSRPNLPHR